MFDGISVNHGAMQTGASDLADCVRRIDERMNRLEDELKDLRSEWGGDAQVAYHQAKAKWDQAILEMKDLLAKTSVAVQEADGAYINADRTGAALFGG